MNTCNSLTPTLTYKYDSKGLEYLHRAYRGVRNEETAHNRVTTDINVLKRNQTFVSHSQWESATQVLKRRVMNSLQVVEGIVTGNLTFEELYNNTRIQCLQMELVSYTFLTSSAQRPQFYSAVSLL